MGKTKSHQNRHQQIPLHCDASTGVVLETSHGQPQAFQGAIIHPGPSGSAHSTGQTGPIVLNTRHGQPEPFQGAVLNTGAPSHMTNQTSYSGAHNAPIVLNTRHGQPESFGGAILSHSDHGSNRDQQEQNQPLVHGNQRSDPSGFVLGTHHGQPQPFAGAVLSSGGQSQGASDNSRLVAELQEQNRLLRMQLRQQHGRSGRENDPEPSAPLSESPPSYESCLADPTKIQYLEQQNEQLHNQFQEQEKRLRNKSVQDDETDVHPKPSAPTL